VCANIINIGLVTPEIARANNSMFLDKTAKIGISHRIFRHVYRTELHQLFRIIKLTDISFAVA